MIKIVALTTGVSSFIIAALCYYFFNYETALSAFAGGGLMTINLLGLWMLWSFIFSKKSIALVVLIIIFKYVILGLILWNLNQQSWMRPIGLVLGLSALIVGVISSMISKMKRGPYAF